MSIEFGVAATHGTAAELLAGLSGPAAILGLGEPVASIDKVRERTGDFGPVVAGDLDGCGFVIDGDLEFLDPDKIVEASRRLRRLVICISGDAARGAYWLCIAESGIPTRVHWTSVEDQTEPFDEGWLLQSETVDVSGWGLFAAMKSFGFDYGAWYERGSKAMVEIVGDDWMTGPIATRINEFAAEHRPIGWAIRSALRPLP
jgi:hypothetical protein